MTDSSSENEIEVDSKWSNLRTNTMFDEKSNKQVVLRRKSSGTSIDELDTGKTLLLDVLTPSTPYSLLVQSLIKQLCNFIEGNKLKSTELYHKICSKLHELRMIDESYNRSEFENIRSSYEAAITALVKVARENTLPTNQDVVEFPLNGETQQALEWSRYYKDFEEIEKIAHGGFADVFKAKHKLDNHIYAIKKILIKSTSVKNILPHLREVKTFASLNHSNVVPYKCCWLEPLISYEPEKRITHEEESWFSQNESTNIRITKSNDSLRLESNNNDSFSIKFEHSENHQSDGSALSSILTNNESLSNLERIRNLQYSTSSSESKALIPHVKLAWSVLYIQMKLCEKTLKNFLDERNECESFNLYYKQFNLNSENNTTAALTIFQQICNGIEYIHSRSIVHHDLKPGNVFVSFESTNSTLLFQLGDFGLSCPLDSNELVSHYGFGTRLYAAKEQLEGRICTKKSDIYSLGVVLIELLLRCKTVMECFKKVERLKKGEDLEDIEHELCQFLSKLLSNKAELRPEIRDIKQNVSRLIDNSSNEVARLKHIIVEKDLKINELMEEIKSLKQKLSNE